MPKKTAIIGLGYVGLPLALLAAKKGHDVIGIDVDTAKVDSLTAKKSYIDDISDKQVASSKAKFTTDMSEVRTADFVVVCVPTPVDQDKQPDLTILENATKGLAKYVNSGTMVIIESTINPGVCDKIIRPLLEAGSGKTVGKDIYLAHCPERVNPGDPHFHVGNINRVVGANSEKELAMAVDFYKGLIDADIKPMGSIKEAEAVKVVENTFRDINIAFVNELAMSFHRLGINVENVLDGAATKPFAFMAHRPGTGVGGHCIPVDPYYLIEYAHQYNFDHEFLLHARNINERMPNFTIDLLEEGLNEIEEPLKGTRVALLGLSYKQNVGDDRESPAYILRSLLQDGMADLITFDPYIQDESGAKNLSEALKKSTAVVIATAHDEFKAITPKQFANNGIKVVIDGRNMFKDSYRDFAKHGIIYHGIGVR